MTNTTALYVQQKLRIKLSTFKGEWYLDNTLGIDYFNSVLIKDPNLNLIEDVYKTKISEVDGVEEIVEFDLLFDKSTRTFTIDFKVKITTGEEISLTV